MYFPTYSFPWLSVLLSFSGCSYWVWWTHSDTIWFRARSNIYSLPFPFPHLVWAAKRF